MLNGLCLGEEAGARNPCIFPFKVVAAGDERYLVCGGCGCGRFCRECVPPLCSATSGGSCVHSSIRFLNLWLQITVEWLHDLLSSGVAMCVERCGLAT